MFRKSLLKPWNSGPLWPSYVISSSSSLSERVARRPECTVDLILSSRFYAREHFFLTTHQGLRVRENEPRALESNSVIKLEAPICQTIDFARQVRLTKQLHRRDTRAHQAMAEAFTSPSRGVPAHPPATHNGNGETVPTNDTSPPLTRRRQVNAHVIRIGRDGLTLTHISRRSIARHKLSTRRASS